MTLSPWDSAIAQLMELGYSPEVAAAEIRRQRPEIAPPAVLEPDDDALEAEVEEAADRLMRALGFHVVRLSQRRASKVTLGVPDRYYLHPRRSLAVWVELKRPNGGRVRPEQLEFQRLCQEARVHHVLGGIPELKAWLIIAGVVERFDGNGLPLPYPTQEQ